MKSFISGDVLGLSDQKQCVFVIINEELVGYIPSSIFYLKVRDDELLPPTSKNQEEFIKYKNFGGVIPEGLVISGNVRSTIDLKKMMRDTLQEEKKEEEVIQVVVPEKVIVDTPKEVEIEPIQEVDLVIPERDSKIKPEAPIEIIPEAPIEIVPHHTISTHEKKTKESKKIKKARLKSQKISEERETKFRK